MSAQTSSTAPAPGRPPAPASSAGALSKAQGTTLLWSMFAGFTTLYIAYSGLLGVLLPIQVEQIAPDSKEASLATVTMVSSIVTLFIQPVVGAMSDRTRGRFGRRTPWMALGAVGSVLALVALGQAGSLLWLTLLWVAAQVLLNVIQAPLTAIMADRVSPERFGVYSAAVGIGSQVGATIGVLVATSFASRFSTGYAVFAALVLVVTLAFVLLNKDRQSTAPVEPFSWGAFVKGFWISPRKHPDFAWAFLARVVFILGYWGIFAYQRYALTDYVGLKGDDVNHVQTVMALLTMAGTLVASIPAGRISDRTGRRKIFVMGSSVVLAVACAVPLISPTATGMYVYAVLAGVGFGTYMSLDMALMTEVLPSGGDAGKDLGILNIATNVPQALGPMVGAWIIGAFSDGADKVPGYHVLFGYAIVVVLLGAVAIKPIKSVK
ncbi:MFS transporter [Streptomyces spiroverticillatus]|uniref:MFS transporter n=1 Tax=Streptomyces finlayi TaxID=67296 RepID=A0A918WY26_9ACTN|nr:MFS transporter [Streptomyces finlayi]GHA11182.1 MFS transporter [Streptomyces spiroverticillatus]GHC95132.1 MFS transporter [Streptomyces finlayi]